MDAPIRVLHVDDEPGFPDVVAEFLEREDDRIAVETATSAEAGLERLAECEVDCVVSNYEMPGMDGLEFLDAVRADRPDLPFVLFTGRGDEGVASEAISRGVTDYIRKRGETEQYAVLANRIVNAVERYRSRRAAEETERRLSELTEATNDVLWMFSADWDALLFVNSAYESIYGRPVADLRANPGDFLRAVHPDDREAVRRAMDRLSDGESVDVEYRVNPREDFGRWVWVRGEPITDDEGTVVRVAGFSRDVTGRREDERELRRKTRAMDAAPVGITISDPDREDNPLVYANDRFESLTGYDRAAALGRNCRFLQGEGSDPDRVAELREAIDAEEPVSVELRNYRADGTEFWNRVTVAPIEDGDGEVVNYVGFQEDVTDRKEREERLRTYKRAVEGANDHIAAFDAGYRYLFANRRYCEYHGIDPSTVPGARIDEVLDEGLWSTIEPYVDRVLAGETVEFRTTLPREHRADRTFEVRYYPLDDGTGEVVGGVATMHDVTEQQERERQLDVLDRVLRHNVRNAMDVVIGNAERIAGESEGQTRELAENIVETGEDLIGLTDQEHRIVQLVSDPDYVRPLELTGMVERAVEGVREGYPDATVDLTAPEEVHAPALPEMERAVAELVENAIKHSDRPHPAVEVAVEVDEATVTVSVADDGPGVPPHERAILTGEEEIDQLYHGSGLALWLVNWIVNRSDGTLAFEHNEPRGSVVRITLPWDRSTASGDDAGWG